MFLNQTTDQTGASFWTSELLGAREEDHTSTEDAVAG